MIIRSKVFSQALVLALVATLNLTGCTWWRAHFGKKGTTTTEGSQVSPLPGGGDIAGGTRPILTGELHHGQFVPLYFDYDSAKIRPSEASKLDSVAAALRGNSKKLVVEGHCDERGTAEYNRALGERRAQAAREELARMGVDAGRISTISHGKDQPEDMGHDEAAWSKNRRCEFAIVGQ